MNKKTKIELVKEHLVTHGFISTWDAIKLYGATRLSDIVYCLKKRGYLIETQLTNGKDRFGNSSNYATYFLIKVPNE